MTPGNTTGEYNESKKKLQPTYKELTRIRSQKKEIQTSIRNTKTRSKK